jgi:hypothetical protein
MSKAGRKSTDIPALIWWEQHWWTTLLNIRQGSLGRRIEQWSLPKGYKAVKTPEWMTHPGDIHEWSLKTGKDFASRVVQREVVTERILPEFDLWSALKNATSARQVQRVCRQSQWRSSLKMLHEKAAQFVEALRGPRYPRKAKTKDDQRLLYCARVLAGISCRVPFETAVDKLRKLQHPSMRVCKCVECQNRKGALLQDILYVCSVGNPLSRESVPRLFALNEPCKCSHCLIVDQVKSRSARPTK